MRRDFPDWLTAFTDYASFSETPTKFSYWSGVSAIAGALERRVWVDQGRYKLYPNFYIVLVAKAGKVKKSSSVRDALSLLREVPGIMFGPDSITWERLIERMAKTATAENAGLAIDQPNTTYSAITADVDELSTFFDPTNKGLVSALIKLWDCPDKFDRETRMYGVEYIERPCLNMIAGTTPSWIKDSFDRWSQEGGFASRAIFLHADQRSQLLPFPKRRMPSNRQGVRASLVADLLSMSHLRGEYKVEEDAYDYGEEWYRKFNTDVDKGFSEATGFTSRKLDHALKLAMVIAASRRDGRYITLKDFKDATAMIDGVEPDLATVFKVVDERAELRPFYDIQAYLRTQGKVKRSTLMSQFGTKYMLREIEGALNILRESGELTQSQEGATLYLTYVAPHNA